jgi:hypothetical protein
MIAETIEWVRASDQQPPGLFEVLIISEGDKDPNMGVGYWDDSTGQWFTSGDDEIYFVTHWAEIRGPAAKAKGD